MVFIDYKGLNKRKGNGMFFEADKVEKVESNFEALPVGRYQAICDGAEMAETRSGVLRYVKTCFTVTQGRYANRKVFGNFNLEIATGNLDESERGRYEMATKIGKSDFAKLCKAVGIETLQSEADLAGFTDKTLVLDLGQRKDKRSGEMANSIKNFFPAASGEPFGASTDGVNTDTPKLPF